MKLTYRYVKESTNELPIDNYIDHPTYIWPTNSLQYYTYMYMSKIHHECEYKEVRRATKKCNKQETRKTKQYQLQVHLNKSLDERVLVSTSENRRKKGSTTK